jgi:short-subunit dehydrogenase
MTSRTILITGASSGIGAALAEVYAAPDARLVLWGRNAERLELAAQRCRVHGSAVETVLFDLHDVTAIAGHIGRNDDAAPIDLAIFNAGLGGTIPADSIVEHPTRALEVATINFTAAVVGASAIASRMVARRRGHITLISSIAETVPLPMAPTYSGSKAGLKMFADALRLRLESHGVSVTVVAPGFVDTPMSQQVTQPKPFMISAEAAARSMKRIIDRRSPNAVVPWPYALLRALYRPLPRVLRHAIVRAMPAD